MCRNYVIYRRVSTATQGKSGLGLEAQEAAVSAFLAGRGSDAKRIKSFTEIESGKNADRPELVRAMELARLTGATLLIAKLDRLSRDAHFLLGLQKAGVEFTAADMPHADKFTVGILAMVAQQEREAISRRTKEALVMARVRIAVTGQVSGTTKRPEIKRLGNPNGAVHLRQFGHKLGVAAIMASAQTRADSVAATIRALRAEGVASANAIAGALNDRSYATPRGGKWTARSVLNVIKRVA